MFILHVDLTVDDSHAGELAAAFRETFLPVISRQPGFVATRLLRKRDSSTTTHRLVIEFETEAFQQAWGNSALHADAWIRFQPLVRDAVGVVFDAEL